MASSMARSGCSATANPPSDRAAALQWAAVHVGPISIHSPHLHRGSHLQNGSSSHGPDFIHRFRPARTAASRHYPHPLGDRKSPLDEGGRGSLLADQWHPRCEEAGRARHRPHRADDRLHLRECPSRRKQVAPKREQSGGRTVGLVPDSPNFWTYGISRTHGARPTRGARLARTAHECDQRAARFRQPYRTETALDTITLALTHHWSTGGGTRLRRFIWSLGTAASGQSLRALLWPRSRAGRRRADRFSR